MHSMSVCNNTNVNSAEKSLKTTQATTEAIAPQNATTPDNKKFVQNVRFVGRLCDLCGTYIALVLAGEKPAHQEEEARGQIFITEQKKQILDNALASFVELRGKKDTTLTINNLNLLFGYVFNAIENSTIYSEQEKEGEKNHEKKSLIYQAKASKSERNKGCEGLEEKETGLPLLIQREWTQIERDRITGVLSKYIIDADKECAEKFNVSSALVRFWKRGERTPTQETLRLLKKEYHFGDTIDDILESDLIIKTERTTILDKADKPLAHNNHPTVKPIALMEYLIKMVTPKGGIVLDPFAGSGSTLVAAKQNGFNYIGIEMTEEYIPIIEARLK